MRWVMTTKIEMRSSGARLQSIDIISIDGHTLIVF